MPRRIFKGFPGTPTHRPMSLRLDYVEAQQVWHHDLYVNSPLARLTPRQYGVSDGRPHDGYVVVDLDTGRDVGMILKGKVRMEIPMFEGPPSGEVDRLPSHRLWIPVYISCEAGLARSTLWQAAFAVVDPLRCDLPPEPRAHDPGAAPEGEDLDAMADLGAA